MHVVYDSVGKTTLTKSLNLLRPRGSLVSFGQASGTPPSINPLDLQKQGSIYLTRPTLASYIQDANELEKRAKNLFKWIDDGKLNIRIDRQLDIDDAQERMDCIFKNIDNIMNNSILNLHTLYNSEEIQQKLNHNEQLFYKYCKDSPINKYNMSLAQGDYTNLNPLLNKIYNDK